MKLPIVPRILLELLAVSFFAASAFALSTNEIPQYSSRVWEVEDGLPHNSVQALAQTRDGYLWIGTQNGLARFDGVRFTVFNAQNTPAIKNSSIHALCEGTDGSLWIGTLNAGLVRFHKDSFTFFSSKEGLVDNSVRALFSSRDGSLWIGTTNGLSRFHNGRFQNFSTQDGLANEIVRGICEDREGTIWIATGNYLNQWKQGVLSVYGEGKKEHRSAWRVVFADGQGNLWAGANNGLNCLKRDGSLSHYDRFNEGLPDSFVISIGEGKDGTLWTGTFGGLGRRAGNKFVTELNSAGETFGQINALLPDQEGNFWVGTKDGLYRLSRKPFRSYTQQHGLPQNNVSSVRESQDGSMWFGTWGGGFAEWKTVTDVIAGHEAIHASHNLYGVSFDQALAIGEARDGTLWFGTDFDGGLFQWTNGKLRRFGQKEGLSDPAIRVIHEDREGNLWLGTRTALVLFKDGKFSRFTTNDGLAGNTIRVIMEDHEGDLWIGTSEGLSRIKNEKLKIKNAGAASLFTSYTTRNGLPHNTVVALHEDSEHTLWIGTGGGLCRIKNDKLKIKNAEGEVESEASETANQKSKIKNQKFQSYTTKDGLFSDEIFEILEDDLGALWMSSPQGIFRVRKKDFDDFDLGKMKSLVCTAYGKADGLSTIQCNGVAKPAGWKARDGRLWFAMTKGAVVVNPNGDVGGNETPPPVVIEEIIVDKKRIQETGDRSQETKGEKEKRGKGEEEHSPFPLFSSSPFLIPPGRGELEFHYTALSFRAPERNRFKYKLEGIDSDWVDAGTRRAAYYNNLKPGDYTFRVIGCNNDGVWNQPGKNVKFTLQPHFWQTKWFVGLLALAAVGVVSGAARYVTWKNVQRKLRRFEQERAIEKERARIAQDMHDDLGARLTEILLLNNAAKKNASLEQAEVAANKVSKVVRETIDNLDALVWAVNPRNDSLPKLATYICEYAGSFLKLASIPCRFEPLSNAPDVPLSSETRHNLFLVVKEALNNIAKYSGATEVWIRFRNSDSHLTVSVEDDGKGFCISEAESQGNGLQNMRKRMESLGGKFEAQSAPGKGTRIRLEIPLKNGCFLFFLIPSVHSSRDKTGEGADIITPTAHETSAGQLASIPRSLDGMRE